MEPDLAGFDAAQRRLRDKLGMVVTFFSPIPAQYDPSLPAEAFDPETGEPHDPTIQPLASGYASANYRCRVLGGPLNSVEAPQVTDVLGPHSTRNVALTLDPERYADVQAASRFSFDDRSYEVRDTMKDTIAGSERVIVYGEAE